MIKTYNKIGYLNDNENRTEFEGEILKNALFL